VHRRNHKERAQPLARAKLGLLEKKKDYILRAKDYKSKKERLKRLREKAAFRNKDEFYWGMIKGKTQGGVHVQARQSSQTMGVDEVKLLKSQDAGYVRLAIAKDESVSRLQAMRLQEDHAQEPGRLESLSENRCPQDSVASLDFSLPFYVGKRFRIGCHGFVVGS
jgi:hypothetical protein